MAFQVLNSIALPGNLLEYKKENPYFARQYAKLGLFYEHRDSTAGHTYERTPFLKAVKRYRADPITVDDCVLDNRAQELQSRGSRGELLAFRATHSFPDRFDPLRGNLRDMVRENYDLYEVYERKETKQ